MLSRDIIRRISVLLALAISLALVGSAGGPFAGVAHAEMPSGVCSLSDESLDASIMSGVQCIGGAQRRTRSGVSAPCITQDKAHTPAATYVPAECVGDARTGLQAEAIAQARILAYLNDRYPHAPGTVAPEVQWELGIGASPESILSSRPDAVTYSPRAGGELQLLEIKVPNGRYTYSDQLKAAPVEAQKYVSAFEDGGVDVAAGKRTASLMDLTGFSDSFTLNYGSCPNPGPGDPRDRQWIYTTAPGNAPGTVVYDRVNKPCANRDNADEEATQDQKPPAIPAPQPAPNPRHYDTHTFGDIIDALVQANVKGAEALRADPALAPLIATSIRLSRQQVQLLITRMKVAVEQIENRSLAAETEVAKVYEEKVLASLAANADANTQQLVSAARAAAADPEGFAAANGITADEARTLGSTSVRDALDGGAAEYRAFLASDLGKEAVAKIDGRILNRLEASLVRSFLRGGLGEALVFVPFVGEALFAIWTIYDLYATVHDLLSMWSWGDPHLVTLDGLSYGFQAAGEFKVLEVPSYQLSVQARAVPDNDNVSTIQAVGFKVGDETIAITDNGAGGDNVMVDGQPYTDFRDGGLRTLDSGWVLGREGTSFIFVSPDGKVDVTWDRSSANSLRGYVAPGIPTQGLLGDHDGNPNNDLRTSSGEQLSATPPASVLYGRFADSWRVNNEDSAFVDTYDDGQDTSTFTDRTFPKNVTTIADFPADRIDEANATCTRHGVQIGPQLNDCVYDLLATGDEKYADAAAAITQTLVDPTAATFDETGALDEDFTAPVATNFAATRYLDDPATGRVAGPIFDDTNYAFYLLSVPRHDQIDMHVRLLAYGVPSEAGVQQSVAINVDGTASYTATLDTTNPQINGPATITYSGASTTATGTPVQIYGIDLPLTHAGAALKVKFVPTGFRASLDTSLGIGSIHLQMTTAPPHTFAEQLPFSVQASTAPGAGNLGTPGAEDDYSFHVGPDRARLRIADYDNSKVAFSLTGPDGIGVKPTSANDAATLYPVREGDYKLAVTTRGSATPYGFRADALPDDVVVGSAIDAASTTAETIAPGQTASFEFAGTAGQRVQLQTANSTFSGMRWTLIRPDGSVTAPWYDRYNANQLVDATTLPQTGTYRALLYPIGDATGSVDFHVWSVPDDANIGSYSLGQDPTAAPIHVATTAAGQNAYVTFEGTAGQRIQMQTSDATFSSGMSWVLKSPDGSDSVAWWDHYAANGLVDDYTLPQTGTYTAYFDPSGTGIGAVDFRAWTVPTDLDAGQYVFGSGAMRITTAAGQNAQLTFVASAGQRVQLQTLDANYTSGGMLWNITLPDGTTMRPWYDRFGANELVDTTTLPQSGTYTVHFDPLGSATGSVSFTAAIVPDDVNVGTYALGTSPSAAAVQAGNTTSGQDAYLTFAGTAGQRLQMQTFGASYSGGTLFWKLYRSDGTLLQGPMGDNSFVDTFTLPSTGTYKVSFEFGGTATGSVNFRAWTVPDDVDAGTLTIDGSAITATTTAAGQNASLTFTATAGQRIQLQAANATMDSRWSIYYPDGSLWYYNNPTFGTNHLIDTTTLPQTGTYKIVVDPGGTTTGAITFRAWSIPADVDAGTMSIDRPSVTVTTVTGQNAALRFQGTAGQRVLLQASGATMDAGWSVLRPDGSQWASFGSPWSSVNSLIDTTTLTQTGTYTINVDPRGTESGSVTFRAWSLPATDLDAGTLAIDGPPLTITIPTAGENGWISFQGTAGQRIQLQGSGSTMDTAWQVIRPDGSQWAAFGSPWSSANSLIDTTTLTQTGTYVIKVDPNGTATGSLTFKAWTVPADLDAGTLQVDSATGVKVTTVPGQNATLSFHGTSGQRVQLQASGATMDAGWAVYRPDGSQWASFGSPWSSVNSLIDTTTLTQTGTYVINIDPRGTASGSITFKAWTVPADLDLPLTLDGTAVTAAIASPGQNATLRFQASAGQRIQVQGSGATMDAAWSLTNPDGSAIASFGPPWTSTNSTVGATTLTQTGTYTVTLDPAGTTTGSVTFKAWALLPDLDLGALPTDGSTTNASNASGQNLTASFTGTQGKSVVVTLANQAGGTVDWKVLDPDGQQVFSATGNTSWYGTLAKTGTYVLKLNPRAPDRTTFTLGVSVTDAPPQLADRLNSGQKLTAGQQLTSPNGGYSLRMQTDGNLVVYGSNNNAIWDSRTWNNPGAYAILQPDGNLVVYRSNNSAAWATGTNGQPVDRAVIQDDGSLVLYTASGSRVWSSR